MLEGVDARRVAVAQPEAEGIPAHRLNGERTDIPADRLPAEPLLAGQLIDALGTATPEPERVDGVEAVCPSFQRMRTSVGDGWVISAGSGRSFATPPPSWSVLTAAARFSATRRKARALGESGSESTMGRPASEVVRISVARAISPRKGRSFTMA